MSVFGGAAAVTMASTSSRPLLVPAADVLAKNMRAMEQATPDSGGPSVSSNESGTSVLMGLGAKTETSALNARQKKARFLSASANARPNPIASLILRIMAKSSVDKQKQQIETSSSPPKPSKLKKLMPSLEKAASLVSKVPDPMLILSFLSLVILVIKRTRPNWLDPLAVRLVLPLIMFLPILLAVVWQRKGLFAMIREEKPILTHPVEHRLDVPEAEVRSREAAVEKALETLKKNEEKVDVLKKELTKEGNAQNADGQIIPSRRAAEIIAAGALGAGFDKETAAQVEQRRREENVKRSREEWRARAKLAEEDMEMKERLRLLADHAATAYNKRTKDLKTKSSPGSNFKKIGNQLAALPALDHGTRHNRRHSERGAALSEREGSTASKRRLTTLFRRRRRETSPQLDSRLTMSESAHVTGRRR